MAVEHGMPARLECAHGRAWERLPVALRFPCAIHIIAKGGPFDHPSMPKLALSACFTFSLARLRPPAPQVLAVADTATASLVRSRGADHCFLVHENEVDDTKASEWLISTLGRAGQEGQGALGWDQCMGEGLSGV